MYRLFWKFFLSFWVALALFAGAVIVAASHYLDEMRERGNAVNPYVQLARDMRAAQAAADTGGIEGLKTWARKVDRREAVPVLVLASIPVTKMPSSASTAKRSSNPTKLSSRHTIRLTLPGSMF